MSKKAAFSRNKELISQVLENLGHDVDGDEGLIETPRRFASYLEEFHKPFDPAAILKDGFAAPSTEGISNLLTQDQIPFRAMCMHHLLPFIGTAAFGYIPSKRVIGLSKIARLIQAVGTEKPSIQEAITERIANILCDHLDPKGLIVVIAAEHTCMSARGVAAPQVVTTTSSVRGVLRDVPAARAEFFNLVRIK